MDREQNVSLVETPGTALRRARERRGVSVSDLASKTRIHPRHVEAIESDRFDDLPEVFAKGYLRSLAREIDLDPEMLVDQFNRHTGAQPRRVHPIEEQRRAPEGDLATLLAARPLPRLSFLAAIIAIILGLGLAIALFGTADPEPLSERSASELADP